MGIEFDKITERYDFNSVITGNGSDNPILYRFVLPKPYFKASSTVSASQMPSESEADPYTKRNLRILEAILIRETNSRKSRDRKVTVT